MSKSPESEPRTGKDAARERRLAEALRANLRRRRQAAKGRAEAADHAAGGAGRAVPEGPESAPETGGNPEESA